MTTSAKIHQEPAIYVYEAPVRIWHWVNAFSILVLALTGYFIVLGRLYWALAGNEHARQIFFPSIFKREFWVGAWQELKWYLFLNKEPRKYIGHNPLAAISMHILFVWGAIFMMFTGLALYGEGAGYDSWQYTYFSSWIIPLLGQSQDVHTFHHLVMWVIIVFVMIHVYVAVREDIMSRQSLISSMISGWRTFKDTKKIEGDDDT